MLTDKRTNGPSDRRTKGPTDQRTDGPTGQRTNGPTYNASYRVACPQLKSLFPSPSTNWIFDNLSFYILFFFPTDHFNNSSRGRACWVFKHEFLYFFTRAIRTKGHTDGPSRTGRVFDNCRVTITRIDNLLGVTFLVRISHFIGVNFYSSGSSHLTGSENLACHFSSYFSGFRKKSTYIFILNSS